NVYKDNHSLFLFFLTKIFPSFFVLTQKTKQKKSRLAWFRYLYLSIPEQNGTHCVRTTFCSIRNSLRKAGRGTMRGRFNTRNRWAIKSRFRHATLSGYNPKNFSKNFQNLLVSCSYCIIPSLTFEVASGCLKYVEISTLH